LSEALLPAAATNSMSFCAARLISSSSACENAVPAQLFDSTRTLAPPPGNAALAWIANSIALIALATLPEPFDARNFSPIMLANQLTPATPAPLLATAPMVPETWVPWK
jgi:hypothetical protein